MSVEAISEEQFLREFTKELHSRNAAVFIGAGFSMSAGYVNWEKLLEGVITDLGLDPKKEHDLVSVAQYSVNKAGGNKNALTRTILHSIGVAKKPTQGHKILANLPIHTFWTTNYDKLRLTMAKRVYFGFDYEDVSDFRANVVRKHNFTGGVEKAGYFDASIWEEAKKKDPTTLKRLINAELEHTSTTAILI